jgi:hypothetical protein
MSFYIAAKIDTKDVLEIGNNSLQLSSASVRDAFKSALSTNYTTSINNIFVYYEDIMSSEAKLVMEGASYALIWSGTTITGIDLSAENAKRIVKCYASKGEIVADGVDTTTITLELWKADGTGIATNVTAQVDIPIMTPNGQRFVKGQLTNGVMSKVFKTTKSGTWIFPVNIPRYKNVRISQIAHVEAILRFEDLD